MAGLWNSLVCLIGTELQRVKVVLVLTVLSLAACSATRFGYQNATELGYWWLDSYFDFNPDQSVRLREALSSLHGWHSQSELPIYVKTLGKLQSIVSLDTTPEQVCEQYSELRVRLQVIFDQFEPNAAALVPSLKLGQIEQLAQQLDKGGHKWRDEWLDASPSKRQRKRFEQMKERFEIFYGHLNESQLAMMSASLTASPPDVELVLRESQRRRQDIVGTLNQLAGLRQGSPEIKLALHGLVARWMDSPDPVYRSYTEKMTLLTCGIVAGIHNSGTLAQRQHLAQTLRDYQADARAMALSNH